MITPFFRLNPTIPSKLLRVLVEDLSDSGSLFDSKVKLEPL